MQTLVMCPLAHRNNRTPHDQRDKEDAFYELLCNECQDVLSNGHERGEKQKYGSIVCYHVCKNKHVYGGRYIRIFEYLCTVHL